jgi:hypothetical protein
VTISERVFYAFYLAIAASMVLILTVAVGTADGVGLLPANAFDLLGSPGVMLGTYVLAFLAAPYVAERFPLKRK